MHRTRNPQGAAIALTLSLLVGCSFVQLTDAGSTVAQASPGDVGHCTSLGVVSARTQDRAVVVQRGAGKVQEELIVLARNQAADLGANAIVPIGEASGGAQRFRAYRCENL